MQLAPVRPAVIDIGSNSVRMVVFDGRDRGLDPLFNEKAMSGLGRGLMETGRLHPEGRRSALGILRRFRRIAEDMGVADIRAVATAAARDAADGPEFIREAAAALGQEIDVLPGEEEARLSALGVLCGIPDADGLVGDLGGGSLELAELSGGAVRSAVSLPIGPLALGGIVGDRREAARVKQVLQETPKGLARGRALYVVGGAWRSLAKYHFERSSHPLHIIHQYEMTADQARRLAGSVGRVRPANLGRLKGISGRRRANAPYSARLLTRLIDRTEPARVVFSGYGLREGVIFEQMPADMQAGDPLLDQCRRLGATGARVAFDGDALADWALGAFPEPPAPLRLVRAAAWLSDMSGHDHPDYRGHNAAARTLTMSAGAISHPERVFLAIAVYARYHGFGLEASLGTAAKLLSPEARALATALGIAFRLAHAIEPGDSIGGRAGLRAACTLRRSGGRVELIVRDGADMIGETAERRLASLARALEAEHAIVEAQSAAA